VIDSSDKKHISLSESEKRKIREQLERLLANAHFSQSKRFPSFLRFVTELTLAGETDGIKERTLGVEIFGRDAEYDTASDPIVRVTAAEIRKRVAQYYQDPAHKDELRITLPSGSYVPQFHWPKNDHDDVAPELTPTPVQPAEDVELQRKSKSPWSRRRIPAWLIVTGICCGLLTAAAGFVWQLRNRSALDLFWQPVLTGGDPVVLCIADQLQYSRISLRDAAAPSHLIELKDNLTAVVMDDVYAVIKVAGILQSNGKHYSLKPEGSTSLVDLRNGPTVFIGAFDNEWTLRLTNPLRYRFANDSDMTHLRIVDSTDPVQSHWVVDRSIQLATNNYRDYAIVARFTDGNTGKLAVIAAGIARGGTIAAGEFLTDPNDLTQLMRSAKAAGDKRNMEVVLSTQIIDGQPGSPKIEAVYFW
jgi:hypothetical protein